MIEVDIQKTLGTFTLNARFGAAAGKVTALFGRSGAGKTTAIDCIAGLARPDGGRVVINGTTVFDHDGRVNRPVEARRVGYVFQEARLFPHMPVADNLTYGRRQTDGPPVIGFDAAVDLLDLRRLLRRMPATLSGGERQRVAIGRALLSNPAVLLMDEPVSALDGHRRQEVLNFVADLKAALSIPILFVSHRLEDILKIADDVVLMNAGQVVDRAPLMKITHHTVFQRALGNEEASAVLAARVAAHAPDDGLTVLAIDGGQLRVPLLATPPGTEVHVRVRAVDVALSRRAPLESSFLNILPGRVERVIEVDAGAIEVRLTLGAENTLWARVNQRAWRDLGLTAGASVFAIMEKITVEPGGRS